MDTTSVAEKPTARCERLLAKAEERYRHELMDTETRLELRELIFRLRHRLGKAATTENV